MTVEFSGSTGAGMSRMEARQRRQPRLAALLLVAAPIAMCLAGTPAQAQLARTYVSAATGVNSGNCDRLTPCRTFQFAHDNTLPNGEITVLDPGGYGGVTITKTISIINDGVGEAGALVSGGATGITINGAATDAVNLRGITVKGIGFGGGNGIVFNSGKSLTMENCVVRNLSGNFPIGVGVVLQPNASSNLALSNTLVTDNSSHGILLTPTGSGSVTTVFSRVEIYNNGGTGLFVFGGSSTGTINGTVVNSVSAGNGGTGVTVSSSSAATKVMVIRSAVVNNQIGFSTFGANSQLRIGATAVTGNATSTNPVAGLLRSYGDNTIDGNADGDPAPATIPRK
jgi:hypothetical protein